MKKISLENLKDPKSFTEYSNNMKDVYQNNEEYNPSRKWFNDLLDIDFKDYLILCQKSTAKSYSLSLIHNTLASDNPLCFRHLLERI